MLQVDFYESGVGETIVVTFPSGGIGIVDAHPSTIASRPSIQELIAGKEIHFACLTHPHADHGRDLVNVVSDSHPQSLWHTISDFKQFIYYTFETQQFFNSPNRDFVERFHREWAEIFSDIFGVASERGIPRHQLRADLQPKLIDGVEIHVLSPEEKVQQEFVKKYAEDIQVAEPKGGDPNLLSAILALHYGGVIVLLGSDALKRNWITAWERHRKAGLPKATILKVPHHGASNALEMSRKLKVKNYFDLCQPHNTYSVLFAGDSSHPEPRVHRQLVSKTNLACLSNGAHRSAPGSFASFPLMQRVRPSGICNPTLSFQISPQGSVDRVIGGTCATCRLQLKAHV